MIVYPAIDLRGGRCVRLVRGEFSHETVYEDDPVVAATRWATAGAEWLHVVDLDGAVVGEPVNTDAIRRIRHAVEIPMQLGGGLRLEEHIAAAFDQGIDRVILGTTAIRSPDLVRDAAARWPGHVAVGLDTRDGRLAAEGWSDQTEAMATDVAVALEAVGVRHFVFTDISRDGTLSGPNVDTLEALVRGLDAGIIASGGVATLDDVKLVVRRGAAGVIIGRALYDGRIDLAAAIAVAAATGEEA